MMKYFIECKTLDELKKEYRRLAMIHHPDVGGTVEAMQAINAEFEALFPVFRMAQDKATQTRSSETAAEYRSEFYTANGWKGTNYDPNLSLKEIAVLVRKFIKENFPTYKFSVRTKYASMCKELHVDMKEAPCEVYKSLDTLTAEDISEIINKANRANVWSLTCWSDEEALAEISRIWDEHGAWYKISAEQIRATAEAVDGFVKSFNYEDCDGMIDYFDVNFYYFGCLQDNARSVKFVPKTARLTSKEKAHTESAHSQSTQAPTATAFRVEINPDFNGIEVYFPSKPSEAVREALKAAGWRWHRKKGCWYNRNTESNLQGLRSIAG